MNHSENLDQIGPALRKAQNMLKPIVKNKTAGPPLHNRYADLEAIWAAVQPVLDKCGLSISQGGGDAPQTIETLLVHDSGQWVSASMHVTAEANKGVSPAQADGIACTYGRRYGLASILCLQVDDDSDGAAPSAGHDAPPSRPAPRADPDTGRSRQAAPSGSGPPCPKCSGEMKPRPAGGKGPLWKCLLSKWRDGEELGCPGAYWHTEDVPEEYRDKPNEDKDAKPSQNDTQTPVDALRTAIHDTMKRDGITVADECCRYVGIALAAGYGITTDIPDAQLPANLGTILKPEEIVDLQERIEAPDFKWQSMEDEIPF